MRQGGRGIEGWALGRHAGRDVGEERQRGREAEGWAGKQRKRNLLLTFRLKLKLKFSVHGRIKSSRSNLEIQECYQIKPQLSRVTAYAKSVVVCPQIGTLQFWIFFEKVVKVFV